jgi:protein-tyrosine phosphatase
MEGVYNNKIEIIKERIMILQERIKREDIDIEIFSGAEFYMELVILDLIKNNDIITINDGNRYVLLELPMGQIPICSEKILFVLLTKGLIPIIAHPERNHEVIKDTKRVKEWIDNGVLIQINGGSLVGRYGTTVRKSAERLLIEGYTYNIASDSHSDYHPYLFYKGVKRAEKLIGKEEVDNMVNKNPEKILSTSV